MILHDTKAKNEHVHLAYVSETMTHGAPIVFLRVTTIFVPNWGDGELKRSKEGKGIEMEREM